MPLKVLTKIGTRLCVNRSIGLAHVDTVIFRLSTLLSSKHCECYCLHQIALFQTVSVCPPVALPFLYFATCFFCPSLEALQNSKSQLLPQRSAVEVLFCDACCLLIISNPMLLMSLHQGISRSVLQDVGAACVPVCRLLVKV